MQTFLPYPDFFASARSLDYKRLGKQRVENLQIMAALLGARINKDTDEIEAFEPRGWANHPAVRMWNGHESALVDYQFAICTVWKNYGYKDTCWSKTARIHAFTQEYMIGDAPSWLGDTSLHLSHQSNLVRKDPEFYGPQFPGVTPELEYVWPV